MEDWPEEIQTAFNDLVLAAGLHGVQPPSSVPANLKLALPPFVPRLEDLPLLVVARPAAVDGRCPSFTPRHYWASGECILVAAASNNTALCLRHLDTCHFPHSFRSSELPEVAAFAERAYLQRAHVQQEKARLAAYKIEVAPLVEANAALQQENAALAAENAALRATLDRLRTAHDTYHAAFSCSP
ncbi:hypothetical protein A1Q2_07013 [Trichosporon asahii var. asahii CBS 8904]|uniref:Uncharacterized protein n=1 Tax=Trichosporon asahii var. asahii (strain CBS 8904) TaxID=1220162 RepID=K1V406_TRIAC|nr:hypothetical protein A1Q2_07013 [Trichosporon asahii var. asahii CBS 8904]